MDSPQTHRLAVVYHHGGKADVRKKLIKKVLEQGKHLFAHMSRKGVNKHSNIQLISAAVLNGNPAPYWYLPRRPVGIRNHSSSVHSRENDRGSVV